MPTLSDILENITQITEVTIAILTFSAVFLSLRTLREMQKSRIESDSSKLFIVPSRQTCIVTVRREEGGPNLTYNFSESDLALINAGSGHALEVHLNWEWKAEDNDVVAPPKAEISNDLGWLRIGRTGSLVYIEDSDSGERKSRLDSKTSSETFVGIRSRMEGSERVSLPESLIIQALSLYADDNSLSKSLNPIVKVSYGDTYRRQVVDGYTIGIEALRSEVSVEKIDVIFEVSVHKGSA